MESNGQGGVKKVLMITLKKPCRKMTSKMIAIGATKEEVIKQYSDKISEDFSNDEQIVVGSIYGGTTFALEQGVVKSIFIGAAAY